MTVLNSPDQVFGKVSLNWDLSDVFLMIRPRVWVWGKGPQSLLILLTSHYQNNLSLLRLTLASWLGVLVSFCTAKPVSPQALSLHHSVHPDPFSKWHSFFLIFNFYFILLYNTVLVLPYIDMNPPWVYMSSHSLKGGYYVQPTFLKMRNYVPPP